jgi:hypothetical protein
MGQVKYQKWGKNIKIQITYKLLISIILRYFLNDISNPTCSIINHHNVLYISIL